MDDHRKYFEAILAKMPDKPGYDKWVCGALWHVDRDISKLSEVCPQCGSKLAPKTFYREKKDGPAAVPRKSD